METTEVLPLTQVYANWKNKTDCLANYTLLFQKVNELKSLTTVQTESGITFPFKSFEENECVICLIAAIDELYTLKFFCGHKLHVWCLNDMCGHSTKSFIACPTCRYSMFSGTSDPIEEAYEQWFESMRMFLVIFKAQMEHVEEKYQKQCEQLRRNFCPEVVKTLEEVCEINFSIFMKIMKIFKEKTNVDLERETARKYGDYNFWHMKEVYEFKNKM